MEEQSSVPLTQRPLYYWIFRYCRTLQLLLFGVILISLFFRVLPLELQKRIINNAISMRESSLLISYCAAYLAAVVLAGLSKYLINMLQATIGQRLLIELRMGLFSHLLHLPLLRFRGLRPASAVSALTGELNSIGTFLGEAIAVPVTALLTYVVVIVYMFSLSPKLTLITMAVYPFELLALPLLQKRFNRWNRERVTTVRAMSDTINEAINGIVEIKSYNSYRLEDKRLAELIKRFYRSVITLDLYKYGIKFSGNLFQSLGPFLLFLFGGLLAIKGQFSLGALVAFLSAHEKLYDPWQEMRLFYQEYQNARVLYRQITRLFDQPSPAKDRAHSGRPALPARAPLLLLNGVDYQLPGNINLLRGIDLAICHGEHIALVGSSGCGKSTLALMLTGLFLPTSGRIELNGRPRTKETADEWATAIAMVPQRPFIFSGTLRENLLYGVLNAEGEAAMTGEELRSRLHRLLPAIGLEKDVTWLGMSSIPPRDTAKLLREYVLRMRLLVHDQLREHFEKVVEFYDRDRFLHYATLCDNLIFGESPSGEYLPDSLPTSSDFKKLMQATGLEGNLLELGLTLARISLDMLQQSGTKEELLAITPMKEGEIASYDSITERLDAGHRLSEEERNRLLTLALRYIPARHGLVRLQENFMSAALRARHHFLLRIKNVGHCPCHRDDCGTCSTELADERRDFNSYCYSTYLYQRNIRANILFGSPKKSFEEILQLKDLAWETFRKHGLLEEIIDLGLEFEVGSQGSHLSGGQRQKISLGLALLREATASLDNHSQAQVQDYINRELRRTTVISIILVKRGTHHFISQNGFSAGPADVDQHRHALRP